MSKPLYYREYIYESREFEENQNKNHRYIIFFIFLTIFVFFTGIFDIIYASLNIDSCQDIKVKNLTLDIFFNITGIYNLFYYFYMIGIFSFLYKYTHFFETNGYTTMITKEQKNIEESYEYSYKMITTIFTLIMLLIFCADTYFYFLYFNKFCSSYYIIIYMWIRLVIGLISPIFILIFIHYK
jgi:hypothetical protein